jgi:hypothetical protein
MSSRIQRDGKSAIEKAQELKKTKNLEAQKGKKTHGFNNSFAALNNSSLVEKVVDASISLGDTDDTVEMHVDKTRNIELERLSKFHTNNPDMFLPNDISLTIEDIVGSNAPNYGEYECGSDTHISVEGEYDHDSHISDEYDGAEPWVEVSRRRSSKKKLKFK